MGIRSWWKRHVVDWDPWSPELKSWVGSVRTPPVDRERGADEVRAEMDRLALLSNRPTVPTLAEWERARVEVDGGPKPPETELHRKAKMHKVAHELAEMRVASGWTPASVTTREEEGSPEDHAAPVDPLCHFLDCANLRVYFQGLYCAEHSARMDAYYEAAKTWSGDCEVLHREHFPELYVVAGPPINRSSHVEVPDGWIVERDVVSDSGEVLEIRIRPGTGEERKWLREEDVRSDPAVGEARDRLMFKYWDAVEAAKRQAEKEER